MIRFWVVSALLGLVVVTAIAAQAAWRAVAAHPIVVADIPPPLTGYEAEEHFPGSALLYADQGAPDATAAPAKGVTGTIALPALPVSASMAAAIVSTESGIVTARPFVMGKANAQDRGRAAQCLTAAIYYEAASESDAGQQAVAQVVLNRVRHPAFPATVCGVVYQGSDHAGCQFSFACDGAAAHMPARAGWARASRIAAAALAGYVYAPIGLATHYHTFAVTPAWNRSLVMTGVVGAHFFHRWKGYWGTAAAFRQVYAGGEIVPAPHIPVPLVAPAQVMDPATDIIPLSDAVNQRVATLSTNLSRSSAAPIAPKTDSLPPASPILDRWKDSGKPLD